MGAFFFPFTNSFPGYELILTADPHVPFDPNALVANGGGDQSPANIAIRTAGDCTELDEAGNGDAKVNLRGLHFDDSGERSGAAV